MYDYNYNVMVIMFHERPIGPAPGESWKTDAAGRKTRDRVSAFLWNTWFLRICRRSSFANAPISGSGTRLDGHPPLALLLLTLFLTCWARAETPPCARFDWCAYGGDYSNKKYSPLDQIHAGNVTTLRVAWQWRSIDEAIQKQNPGLRPWLFEVTPLMVRGKLYLSTSFGQVAAVDPETGNTIWSYDPKSYGNGYPPIYGFTHRGIAFWADTKGGLTDERIFIGTVDGYLLALDARTGRKIPSFGTDGRVDLIGAIGPTEERHMYAITSPPVICRNVVVVGSALNDSFGPTPTTPRGDVRGFDIRTGKQLWVFHSVPQKGETGNETWIQDSWKGRRGVSAWAPMSADEELGYVYVPFSSASNDYYGGDRPGNNLFGDSVVALDALSGRRAWHFQSTHHDLWDYDAPAAPTLIDITVSGKRIKALAQVTKQAFCFVLNRVTGEPVWPVAEVAVPQSDVRTEHTAATQPFPSRPAPFDRQGVVSENDLIDFTPDLRRRAIEILKTYKYGPLYTPPSFQGTISMPGSQGGASWAGAAFDPETGLLYIPSVTRPTVMTLLEKDKVPSATTDHFSGMRKLLAGPDGLPLFKPPFGRISAIQMNTGERVWVVPSGNGPRDHPLLKDLKLPKLGWPLRTFVMATKALLFAAQEGPMGPEQLKDGHLEADHEVREATLRAYDKLTGNLLAEIALPANATGSPMTYLHNGKQFVVVAVGGSNLPAELVALALP